MIAKIYPILPIIGCAVVCSLCLTATAYQGWLYLRSSQKRFHGWGAMLSMVTAVFTATSFLQYLQPPDRWMIFIDKAQYSTFPLMVYTLYGFSVRFFDQTNKHL